MVICAKDLQPHSTELDHPSKEMCTRLCFFFSFSMIMLVALCHARVVFPLVDDNDLIMYR